MKTLRIHIFLSALFVLGLQGCASTPGGGSVYMPSEQGLYPAVIVLHSIRGLSSHEEEFAWRLLNQGYVTMTVNYFGEDGNNIERGYKYISTLPNVDPQKIGLVGFSMGARQALYFASRFNAVESNQQIAGIVSYYIGSDIVTWIKSAEHPPILFLHGDQDVKVQPREIINYCKVQKESNTVCDYHIYKGAKHAFDRRSTYGSKNSTVTSDAWKRAVDFLDIHVKHHN